MTLLSLVGLDVAVDICIIAALFVFLWFRHGSIASVREHLRSSLRRFLGVDSLSGRVDMIEAELDEAEEQGFDDLGDDCDTDPDNVFMFPAKERGQS